MTWPTDDIQLGPRSWGRRPATAGVILHTTEYATPARSSAVQCANDQARRTADGGWAQPGSYNFIVYDGGALLTVPYLEASGGINPASPAWAPQAWLQKLLPPAAWADPTMYHLQIAFSGRAAKLAAGEYPANMLETAARLLVWTEDATWGADNLIVSGHLHWQTNRSDPGAGVIDRILERYDELRAPAPPAPPADDSCQAELDAAEAQVLDLQRRVRRLRKRKGILVDRLADAEARITAALGALAGQEGP